MKMHQGRVGLVTLLILTSGSIAGCAASSAAQCDEYWSKKIQADTLALTTRGDIIEEMSKAKPNQARITELELQVQSLESVSEDWFERIQELGC